MHVSCHVSIVFALVKGWMIVDCWDSVKFVGNLGLSRKMADGRCPMIGHR
jgi:hypothetical protein